MGRIPHSLARRIDRLAARAHAFHRFAHHPLCARYAAELVPIGRRARLCRGCALAWAGGLAGLGLGLLLPPPGPPHLLGGLALLALLAVFAVRPRGEAVGGAKLARRFLPMALCAALAVLGPRAGGPAGLGTTLAAACAFGLALLGYRGRGPDRRACATCPEAPASAACSGFAPMARRERAFRRLAGRWLARSNDVSGREDPKEVVAGLRP